MQLLISLHQLTFLSYMYFMLLLSDTDNDYSVLHCVLYSVFLDLYPRAGSVALGWVSSPSEFMDPKTCRKCSVDAVSLY